MTPITPPTTESGIRKPFAENHDSPLSRKAATRAQPAQLLQSGDYGPQEQVTESTAVGEEDVKDESRLDQPCMESNEPIEKESSVDNLRGGWEPRNVSWLKVPGSLGVDKPFEEILQNAQDIFSDDNKRPRSKGRVSIRIEVQEVGEEKDQVKDAPTLTHRHEITKTAKGIFDLVLPVDIKKTLAEDSSCCVATTQHGQRCSRGAPKEVGSIEGYLEIIRKGHSSLNYQSCLSGAEQCAEATLCYQHLRNFKSRINKVQDMVQHELSSALPHSNDLTDFVTWAGNISRSVKTSTTPHSSTTKVTTYEYASSVTNDGDTCTTKTTTSFEQIKHANGDQTHISVSSQTQATTTLMHHPKLDPEAIISTLVSNLEGAETRLIENPTSTEERGELRPKTPLRENGPILIAWQPPRNKPRAVDRVLISEAGKPLTLLERKSAYLYIYWRKDAPNYLKIGYSGDRKGRLAAWGRKCEVECEARKLSWDAMDKEVLNAKRVEKLIHTELKEYRHKLFCNCSSIHDEWFMVSEERALRAFLRWSKWSDQQPYEKEGPLWELKRKAERSLDCTAKEAVADHTEPHPR
ncbi:T5orf172 domain-domain-containing protein [Clohesyomyces aquaticus]|uniref:T5orf172 domain-domain-containing protein n=1 Tax=Clohesyomyces aquaticus TaxID=1231657 RepID=A0A1Y1ZQC9_9PLEO|nr:T5orf172 domain-domain-containing protein [Clohesyomyces aquaticus]